MDARMVWAAARRALSHVVVPARGSRGDYGWFGVEVAWARSMDWTFPSQTRERGHGLLEEGRVGGVHGGVWGVVAPL
jgi:hypothetical protein